MLENLPVAMIALICIVSYRAARYGVTSAIPLTKVNT